MMRYRAMLILGLTIGILLILDYLLPNDILSVGLVYQNF